MCGCQSGISFAALALSAQSVQNSLGLVSCACYTIFFVFMHSLCEHTLKNTTHRGGVSELSRLSAKSTLYFRAVLLNEPILSPPISILERLAPCFVSDLTLCLPWVVVGSRAFFKNSRIAFANNRPVNFIALTDNATALSFTCSCNIFIPSYNVFTVFFTRTPHKTCYLVAKMR